MTVLVRATSTLRVRRHRMLRDAGIVICPVPVDGDMITYLRRLDRLEERHEGDRNKVGLAIAAALAEAAKHHKNNLTNYSGGRSYEQAHPVETHLR
jgi:hypothetical protein